MMRRANIGVNHQPGASDSVCIRQSSEVRWRFQRYSPFRIALASSAIRRARGRRGYFPELSTSSTRRFSVPKPRLSGRAARGRCRLHALSWPRQREGLESLWQQDWIAYATRRDWNRQTK
jgi:hypothetical protein